MIGLLLFGSFPATWPHISMTGSDNMRKVTARDLQDIRVRYQVASMWGAISPNWDLLDKHWWLKNQAPAQVGWTRGIPLAWLMGKYAPGHVEKEAPV